MSEVFPAADPARWRELAQKALKDRPLESLVHLDADGLAVRPLYGAATGATPVFAPRASDADGRAWDLRVLVEGDEASTVNRELLADLEGGAASAILRGGVLADSEPLGRALSDVALELAGVALDAGADGPNAANALAVAAKGAPRARLMFHMDPVSAFAELGGGARTLEEQLSLAANTAARHAEAYPLARHFLASGRAVHEAGGSIGQELGFMAANAAALVRAGLAAGLSAEAALKGTVLGLATDQQYFDSLAKVRAARLIWRTLSRAFGHETPAEIEVRSSRRMLAARDPWPNLLRLTAAGFAGAVGGADALVLDGFSRAEGVPDAFARRQARNTQLVLMEEAHLGRVDDPASGAWFLDHRTRELAEAGWAEFQRIEAEGGIVDALMGDVVQPRVGRAREVLERSLGEGGEQMVGVTKFIDPDPRPAHTDVEPTAASPALEVRCTPLTPVRLAARFEDQGAQR